MINTFKIIPLILLSVFLTLFSCGGYEPYSPEEEKNVIVIWTNLIRNYQEGEESTPVVKSDTLLSGETFFLSAVPLNDNVVLTELEAEQITARRFWLIDGTDSIGKWNTSLELTKPGPHSAVFHFVDPKLDTLRDTILIWINTPLSITGVQSPTPGRRDIPTSTFAQSHMTFEWDLTGVDSSEVIMNTLYLSLSPDSVYNYGVAVVQDSTRFDFSIDLYDWLDSSSVRPDSSYTFYWTVVSQSLGANTLTGNIDSSNVHSFKTAFADTVPSKFSGYFRYDVGFVHSGIQIQLQSESGSVRIASTDNKGFAKIDSLQPGYYTLICSSPTRPEFSPESLQFILPANSHFALDSTLKITDLYPPQILFLSPDSLENGIFRFKAADYGSGLHPDNIEVYANGALQTIQADSGLYKVDFNKNTSSWLTLQISATDSAGNETGTINKTLEN